LRRAAVLAVFAAVTGPAPASASDSLTDAVVGAVRAHPLAGDDVDVVRVVAAGDVEPLIAAGAIRSVSFAPREDFLGPATVRVEVGTGHTAAVVWARVLLRRRVTAVRARVPLRGGRVLAAGDVDVVHEWIERDDPGALREAPDTSAGDVVARRDVGAGETLRRGDVVVRPLSRRGDFVRVVHRRGDLTVEAAATLVTEGRLGETVTARNAGSGKDVSGVLVARGVVEVPQ
jgi:flagella basal body P-ring formation protein FlgA